MFRHLCAEEEVKKAEERILSDKERKVLLASSLLGHTVRVNEYNYTYDTIDMSTKKMYIEKAGKQHPINCMR